MSKPEIPRPADAVASAKRLASLDQFRGYTVLGMLLVNYFGGFAVCPQVLRHTHDYCSYADTIMPQFLFAVGFALRLSFGRRMQLQGSAAAFARMYRRLLGLVLVSLVVYNVGPRAPDWALLAEMGVWEAIREPLKRSWFQTLMHIAVTSIWILPVVHASARARILWMLGSALAHVWLSYCFNFTWVNTSPNGIDGGPLGFLTWTIPAIVGTLACDVFLANQQQPSSSSRWLYRVLAASLLLMALGYVFSCGTRLYDVSPDLVESLKSEKLAAAPVLPAAEQFAAQTDKGGLFAWLAEPPFVKPPDQTLRKWNYWMMSQRAGTLSYLTFSAGFSLAVFLLFYLVCDVYGYQLAVFRTFGMNALVAYVLHSMVSTAVKPFFPNDSPAWFAYLGLALFFFINWVFVRHLEKEGVFLRV